MAHRRPRRFSWPAAQAWRRSAWPTSRRPSPRSNRPRCWSPCGTCPAACARRAPKLGRPAAQAARPPAAPPPRAVRGPLPARARPAADSCQGRRRRPAARAAAARSARAEQALYAAGRRAPGAPASDRAPGRGSAAGPGEGAPVDGEDDRQVLHERLHAHGLRARRRIRWHLWIALQAGDRATCQTFTQGLARPSVHPPSASGRHAT